MGVVIRLVRMGLRNEPFYNIAVSHKKIGLNKLPIEVIGVYRATPTAFPNQKEIQMKEVQLDFDRARYWLGVGALPSDTVSDIFRKFNILPKKQKSKSKNKKVQKEIVESSTEGLL
ncbi:ribosomal protein S16 domain-containing protein [Lipomyces arxii]|uniref:ribosomal protein S16 domain-containing protein n=1 Tax=Lipomyces arxii TaxID=56418 RepID=UPI0034CE635E